MKMSIYDMSKEELELYSYKDLTNMLLKEKGAMNTADLFKEITKLLELPSSVFENKIGDYYTTLTNDKHFIMLDDGKWDLRENHTSDKVVIINDSEEEEEEEEEEDLSENKDDEDSSDDEDNTDDYDSSRSDDDFDDSDDDLKDLVILDEDELELEE